MMVMMMMMLLLMLIDCMYGVQVASAPFFALRTVYAMSRHPCLNTSSHTRIPGALPPVPTTHLLTIE